MKAVTLGYRPNPAPRVENGIRLLKQALLDSGYDVKVEEVSWTWDSYRSVSGRIVFVGNRNESELLRQLEERDVLLYHTEAPEGEGFYLAACPGI